MEELENFRAWLSNEEEIAKILLQLAPLLEKRHDFEKEVPELGLLRGTRTVPGEEPPKLTRREETPRQSTLLVGSRSPLEGDKERKVPTIVEFNKLVAQKKAANRKKHEKAKKKKKAKNEKMEEDPPPPATPESESGKKSLI